MNFAIPFARAGSATAAAHQRRLLALLAVGVVALGVIAAWVLRQADQSAQQLAATGQSLMQSQRLAKSVSQALVGSPRRSRTWWKAPACWRATSAPWWRRCRAGRACPGRAFKPELDSVTPMMERAERNAGVVMGQQKILTQVGDACAPSTASLRTRWKLPKRFRP